MSRRRGEFEHRTSIFEGAFRAWSHLGGLSPEDVESKPTSDLDPLNNPIDDDPRLAIQRKNGDVKDTTNPDGSLRRAFPYEPLPRAGLAHPYVQAILSPWLGPDADNEAIQLGLTTLRTWWQHRRKGESGSAIAALGTEKMKGVVEGYTRHFFTLAHCLVTNDKEQPPRTLHGRMKELEKARNKRGKKKGKESEGSSGGTDLASEIKNDLTDSNLSPLERLHAAQRRQLQNSGTIRPSMDNLQMNTSVQLQMAPLQSQNLQYPQQQPTINMNGQQQPTINMNGQQQPTINMNGQQQPTINMSGPNFPGEIDLSGVGDQINRTADQQIHRGEMTPACSSSSNRPTPAQPQGGILSVGQYGDNNTTPVVFVSSRGDIMIAMDIEGITCAHCVKIIETVLKGCSGSKSPIEGLVDAAADQKLSAVLIKIDKASNAKRVAFESARNLSMVGYTAKAKEMSIVGAGADKKSTMELGSLSTAFEVVANTDSKDFFDWRVPCTCPDNGVLRQDCHRHSQMNTRIFEAFEAREKQVMDYMAGCGMKYGMPCSCGPNCRCKNCPVHCNGNDGDGQERDNSDEGLEDSEEAQILAAAARMSGRAPIPSSVMPRGSMLPQHTQPHLMQQRMGGETKPYGMAGDDDALRVDQKMEFFGMEPPVGMVHGPRDQRHLHPRRHNSMHDAIEPIPHNQMDEQGDMSMHRRSLRNPSIISYGGLRHMSMNSETTFGRAMSGLSALSIDWENLEDFDLDLDHSAHINNSIPAGRTVGGAVDMGYGATGGLPSTMNRRRSSIRRPHGATTDSEAHVSFKV